MFPFDTAFAMGVASERTLPLTHFCSVFTNLGDAWLTVFAVSIACIVLFATKRRRFVPELFTVVAGSALSVWMLKLYFVLPRPTDPIALMTVDSYSFPSGHAAASMALYGFLIWILVGTGKKSRGRTQLAAALSLLIIMIGYSRLYLGVHYLSDVVAGYFVGLVWIGIGIMLSRTKWIRRLR